MEQGQAFRTLKRMAVGATELFAPDFGGANSGTNPFILLPGASSCGISSSLVQFSIRSSEEEKAAMVQILETSFEDDSETRVPQK